ncbi:MAG: hypothetical protein MHM6MM_002874 [Cercozoa sp. M6MM]
MLFPRGFRSTVTGHGRLKKRSLTRSFRFHMRVSFIQYSGMKSNMLELQLSHLTEACEESNDLLRSAREETQSANRRLASIERQLFEYQDTLAFCAGSLEATEETTPNVDTVRPVSPRRRRRMTPSFALRMFRLLFERRAALRAKVERQLRFLLRAPWRLRAFNTNFRIGCNCDYDFTRTCFFLWLRDYRTDYDGSKQYLRFGCRMRNYANVHAYTDCGDRFDTGIVASSATKSSYSSES